MLWCVCVYVCPCVRLSTALLENGNEFSNAVFTNRLLWAMRPTPINFSLIGDLWPLETVTRSNFWCMTYACGTWLWMHFWRWQWIWSQFVEIRNCLAVIAILSLAPPYGDFTREFFWLPQMEKMYCQTLSTQNSLCSTIWRKCNGGHS